VRKEFNYFYSKNVVMKMFINTTFNIFTYNKQARRKQGRSQASNDNAKGKAKSAGADLRRYNEAALQKDIRALIDQWKSMIEESELIFVHAPSANKNIIYNYEEAVLKKGLFAECWEFYFKLKFFDSLFFFTFIFFFLFC